MDQLILLQAMRLYVLRRSVPMMLRFHWRLVGRSKAESYELLGKKHLRKPFCEIESAHNDRGANDGRRVGKLKKGFFPLYVGDERQRFQLPIGYLKHPLVGALLERSAKEFGYDQNGVLRIPCDVQSFQDVLRTVYCDATDN